MFIQDSKRRWHPLALLGAAAIGLAAGCAAGESDGRPGSGGSSSSGGPGSTTAGSTTGTGTTGTGTTPSGTGTTSTGTGGGAQPLPVVVDDFFAPSGYMEDARNGNATMTPAFDGDDKTCGGNRAPGGRGFCHIVT